MLNGKRDKFSSILLKHALQIHKLTLGKEYSNVFALACFEIYYRFADPIIKIRRSLAGYIDAAYINSYNLRKR